VVTIHDTIPERFPELTLPTRRARLFWRAKVSVAIAQAHLVLTVSQQSARDIVAYLGVRSERIRVAPNAPAAAFRPSDSAEEIARVAARVGLPPGARWFVYVGGCNPHKRLDIAVRAHAALVAERGSAAPWPVLVGPDDDVFHADRDSVRALIHALGSAHRVAWTGFLEDEVLRHLHSGAVGLVLRSQLEGTGLPALEAAACGTPVVATTASPLPELLAGGGVFVAPGDEAALRGALARLLDDGSTRRSMGAAALTRARTLDWADSGARALAALREAAA
jgi:alpha-1,3-rhamnosyl/mannosyltransferase